MRYLMFDHTKKHHIICTLTSTDRYIYIYATKICRFVNIGYNIIEHVKPWLALAVKDECRARRED